jgi:hypothetical protein
MIRQVREMILQIAPSCPIDKFIGLLTEFNERSPPLSPDDFGVLFLDLARPKKGPNAVFRYLPANSGPIRPLIP